MKTRLLNRPVGIAARALSFLLLVSILAPADAAARVCSHDFGVTKPPGSTGMFWIHTNGKQEITFKYFGRVTRIAIWSSGQRPVKYYEGPPIPSFNSPGIVGISGEGETYSSIRITTDWQSPLRECR